MSVQDRLTDIGEATAAEAIRREEQKIRDVMDKARRHQEQRLEDVTSEAEKRGAQAIEDLGREATRLRYPSGQTITEAAEERYGSGPTPVKVDSIAERCNRLRIELANIGDLVTKITGVYTPTAPESGKPICSLDHIDCLLDECFAHARHLLAQLDRIHERLARRQS